MSKFFAFLIGFAVVKFGILGMVASMTGRPVTSELIISLVVGVVVAIFFG